MVLINLAVAPQFIFGAGTACHDLERVSVLQWKGLQKLEQILPHGQGKAFQKPCLQSLKLVRYLF